MNNEISLERIIPDDLDGKDEFDQQTLRLHRERYHFAIENGKPGNILDVACGTGYGSFQIIQDVKFEHSRITAVDIDKSAIGYASLRYEHPQIRFVLTDAFDLAEVGHFDMVVSLETIEHLNDPALFIKKIYSLLKSDGALIISAPVTPSMDANPNHLSDFTSKGLKGLLENAGFEIYKEFLQEQPYTLESIFYSKNKRLAQKRKGIGKYYLRNPNKLIARLRSLAIDGLKNKYLTLALTKRASIHSGGSS